MRVKIEKLDHFGRGITKIDNKICFVEGALTDEVVDAEIVKEKSKYLEGKTTKVIDSSKYRKKVECPYYDVCGGCNLLHLSYDEENKFKEMKVAEILKRYGNKENIKINSICFGEKSGYRNKVVLHGSDGKLGFYKEGSNELVQIKSCMLLPDIINKLIDKLNDIARESDIRKVTIRVSNDLDKVMVKIDGKISDISSIRDMVDVLIINDQVISLEDKIISKIGDVSYSVSIGSFFQVNRDLTFKLYEKVLEHVRNIRPNKVLDLYCGTGTIGIYVSKYALEIVGVDSCKSSIDNAFFNKKLNNVNNINFICDKVENVIDQFNNMDLIIVDPPRAGLDTKTINYIDKIAPDTIIYVSCDPVTLARDLNSLDNYEVLEVTPFNMFPRTYHVECVTVLWRKTIIK